MCFGEDFFQLNLLETFEFHIPIDCPIVPKIGKSSAINYLNKFSVSFFLPAILIMCMLVLFIVSYKLMAALNLFFPPIGSVTFPE